MHWIVEKAVIASSENNTILRIIKEKKLSHSVTTLCPFEHSLRPEPAVITPLFAYGSIQFIKEGMRRGWPMFYDHDLNWYKWKEHWDGLLVNNDVTVCELQELTQLTKPTFIRPVNDFKAFSGCVVAPANLEAWFERVYRYQDNLSPSTKIIMCVPQSVQFEWRLFIVNGKIVTGTLYNVNGKLCEVSNVPPEVVAFGQQCVDRWSPLTAYVLDIAKLSTGELKIIETNCIHSAGLYVADIEKLVDAVEELG